MSKRVVYAKLHDGFFIPSVGNMKDTLPPDSKTLSDFNMYLQENGGLLLSWTSLSGGHKLLRSYMVGAATVKGVLFEDEIVSGNAK